eukprot:TRINITY_DN62811_c0_g1_i1.p1 TRINITY_DN62811_c0_g1~~TRINITY_DN62811_c0_g1_i1.p1  ORF type:complete len:634 (+),score=76.68 TRINITY_DN62811_c0_g1_i1:25-1926(+)
MLELRSMASPFRIDDENQTSRHAATRSVRTVSESPMISQSRGSSASMYRSPRQRSASDPLVTNGAPLSEDKKPQMRSCGFVPVHLNFDDDDVRDPSVSTRPPSPVAQNRSLSLHDWLRNASRIDTSANLFSGQTMRERLLHYEDSLRTAEGQAWLSSCLSKSLGFGNRITGAEIMNKLENTDMEKMSDGAVFVMKLGIVLSSCGYCSVDVEYLLLAICEGTELPLNRINVGMGQMDVCFGAGHSFLLRASGGLQFDKILACVRLGKYVSSGVVDARAAIMLLDEIVERRKPYGQLVHMAAFVCLCGLSAICVRMGTFRDGVAAAVISIFPVAVLKLCKHGYHVTELVDFLVPVATGLGTSVLWRYLDQAPICHVPTWYLAVLIDFLPGAQLVYAAYEFQLSSIIYSTSRLVRALLQCMLLAIGLTTGWQFFGQNLASAEVGGKTGPLASLPPTEECNDAAFHKQVWSLYFGVFNLPLLCVIMIGANIRLRDMRMPLLIAYVSLFIYGFLTFAHVVELPAVVVNVIVVSVNAHLGSLHEYLTGTPPILSVMPVIFFLAPGSGTMLCILRTIHKAEGDESLPWQDLWAGLVMQGLSYAIGLHLATAIWRPMNFKRARAIAANENEPRQSRSLYLY